MSRKYDRDAGMRSRLAAAAARIMAEDGIDDFALAKRKAARQLGVTRPQALPGNEEIEERLQAYRALYQPVEHENRLAELRRIALNAMRALAQFNPYLTGPVLKGTAGPYAEIDVQLFPTNAKEVEVFFLDRNIPYRTVEAQRFSGDRAHAATVLMLIWDGSPLRVSIFDPRDERITLKSSQAGRVIARAGILEVEALLRWEG
jgi:hypothetical protein